MSDISELKQRRENINTARVTADLAYDFQSVQLLASSISMMLAENVRQLDLKIEKMDKAGCGSQIK